MKIIKKKKKGRVERKGDTLSDNQSSGEIL